MAFLLTSKFLTLLLLLSFAVIVNCLKLGSDRSFPETNLADLFTGVKACDVQLVHDGGHKFHFQHLQFLPSIIFNTKTLLVPEKIFDVTEVRLPPCKIILVLFRSWKGLNPFEWLDSNETILFSHIIHRYLTFRTNSTTPFHYKTLVVYKFDNVFPLVMTNEDFSLGNSAGGEICWKNFEFAGIIRISSEERLQICFVVKIFKILSESKSQSTCTDVGVGSNALQIYHQVLPPQRNGYLEEFVINLKELT